MELVRIEARLSVLKSTIKYSTEDTLAYQAERGGDHLLLKFSPEDAKENSEDKDALDEQIYSRAKLALVGDDDVVSEAQRLRRLKRRSDKKDTMGNLINDAIVFARGM